MGLWLLFRIVGTTWPAAVLPGLLAAGTLLVEDSGGFHQQNLDISEKSWIWLVVWNMKFMTFHILGIVTPTD
jgi:hypothetical protein